jgi:cysteinyl-tRNA synthetase
MDKLLLYNTLTQRKEELTPISRGRVKMFVCGPTVQDRLHTGHAKTYVAYDVLARLLRFMGYQVTFIMNITDVDDKIYEAAKKARSDPVEYADRYAKLFVEDMKELNVSSVDSLERASKYMSEMIRQIGILIAGGHAYTTGRGVYFDVSTFPAFGRLSHQTPEELMLRPVDLSADKKSPVDFALWRRTDEFPSWDSPWGRGRPGWHIEDTAITISNFGPQYDLHGGAYELVYPHHEAEIAQAECVTGVSPLVRYWVHTGLLKVGGEKMSKSQGNAVYLRDVLDHYGANPLRLYILSEHYRADTHFSPDRLTEMTRRLNEFRADTRPLQIRDARAMDVSEAFLKFKQRLLDDLNTPSALDFYFSLADTGSSEREKARAAREIQVASNILGVDLT